jgi:hypothetical protein
VGQRYLNGKRRTICTYRSPWDTEVCVLHYHACDMWLLARQREPCSICPAYNTHCKRLIFYLGIVGKEYTFGFHLVWRTGSH